MIEKFKQFMIGRYGVDQLSNFLNILFFIFAMIGFIYGETIFFIIALVFMGLNYFRMFSKNFSKRYNENRIYTNMMSPIYNFFDKIKSKFTKRKVKDKSYKYFNCKNCGQELRIPKGKGKVSITCPKCQHSFEGRS